MTADDLLLWQSANLLKNTLSKMPRTQLVVLGSNSKQNAETLKTCKQQNADETPEHGTPAEALMQPNSSEANHALLLEKYFTNRFAVEYKGSDEIDQPMQLSGKSVDRRALGFKTCAIGRLASTNSSMISVLSSNKQKSPLIAERSAASFPCGPVRLAVIRTN
jgi:hypothetical protein